MKGGAGMPVTPEEQTDLMARDISPDLRLAVRMPRNYRRFHRVEAFLHDLLEQNLIDEALFNKVRSSRYSYLQHMPAEAAEDWVENTKEAKNPAALIAPVSQTVGGVRVGTTAVPVRRSDIGNMDAREITAIIQDKLVRKDLSFEAGMELLEALAGKMEGDGQMLDSETKDIVTTARKWKRLVNDMLAAQEEEGEGG